MKNLFIALLMSIAFVGCSKEDIDGCGYGCEVVTTTGDPNCGTVVGGGSFSEYCPDFGFILVNFNGSAPDSKTVICLTEENMFDYSLHSYYCND